MVDLQHLPTYACLTCQTPVRPRMRGPIRAGIYALGTLLLLAAALTTGHWMAWLMAVLATWCVIHSLGRVCAYCRSPKLVQIDSPPGRAIVDARQKNKALTREAIAIP